MTKYDCKLTERLMSKFTADEEIQSNPYGGDHWLGLYKSDKPGGVICHEDTQGFCDSTVYKEDSALWLAWEEAKSEYEPNEQEPDEEDYVIHDVPGGYKVNKFPDTIATMERAVNLIINDMERSEFWPNVWFCSDHGNMSLLDLDEYK